MSSKFRLKKATDVQKATPAQISALRENFQRLCIDYQLTLNLPDKASSSWLHYYRNYEVRFSHDNSKERYLVAILSIKEGKIEVMVSAWTPDTGENQQFNKELAHIFTSIFGPEGYSVTRRQEYVIFN